MLRIFFQQSVKTTGFFDKQIKTGDERTNIGDENMSLRRKLHSGSGEMKNFGDKHSINDDQRPKNIFKRSSYLNVQ